MKYLLALIGLTMLASCAGKDKPLTLRAILQCESRTLVMAASGNYPEGRAGEIRLYRDHNLNKEFDAQDRTETQSLLVMLKSEDFYLVQPVKLDSLWTDRTMFIVLKAGDDSIVATVKDCSTPRELTD